MAKNQANPVVAKIFEIETGTRLVDSLFANLVTVIWGASGKPAVKGEPAARLPEPGNSE